MKFKLIETILVEGKDIDRTWEQYKSKIMPKLQQWSEANGGDTSEERCKFLWKGCVLSADPTYDVNSNTTGDYGIWLTNMFANGKFALINSFTKYEEVLKEFIKKKSNLEYKDINHYKSLQELKDVLDNTNFSDRQKERQLRNTMKGAKKVFDGKDWEVWVPETYEASCTLGAGSGWCTADTRTREHYDNYLNQGGNYYIIINKHNKNEKYQFHWESKQFFGSGTNPGHELNKEYSINTSKFLSDNIELGQFFEELGYWKDGSNEIYYTYNWDGNEEVPNDVEEVIIDDGVDSISFCAFDCCTSLHTIEIPDSVTWIGSNAFDGCTSLQNLEIPDSVTDIGDSAFNNCNSLQLIEIPNSVMDIGNDAFDGCDSLQTIYLPKRFQDDLSRIGIDDTKAEVIFT